MREKPAPARGNVGERLSGVDPMREGEFAGHGRTFPGERENGGVHAVPVSRRDLGGESLVDPAVDRAPCRAGLPVEADRDEFPERDEAVDSHIGERKLGAVAEGERGLDRPREGVAVAVADPGFGVAVGPVGIRYRPRVGERHAVKHLVLLKVDGFT